MSAEELPVPRTAHPPEVLRESLRALESGRAVVVATVLARRGSTPSTPGQKLCLFRAGERDAPSTAGAVTGARFTAVGTVGGGAVELRILARMVEVLAAGGAAFEPQIETLDLGSSLGMCCGGSVDMLLERLAPALSVLVVGAGHIGGALAPLLAELGFRVVLCDARESAVERLAHLGRSVPAHAAHPGETSDGAGGGVVVLGCDYDDPEVRAALGVPEATAALVMTHDHQLDQAAIEWALGQRFAFVGGVGSRAKAARTHNRLEVKGFAASDIARVRMPLGVEIGARAPLEIALSVAGELVAWRATMLGTSRHVRAPTGRDGSVAPSPSGARMPSTRPMLTLPGVGDGARSEPPSTTPSSSARDDVRSRFVTAITAPAVHVVGATPPRPDAVPDPVDDEAE